MHLLNKSGQTQKGMTPLIWHFEKENLWIWKTCQWLPEAGRWGKGLTIKERHDRILRVRKFLYTTVVGERRPCQNSLNCTPQRVHFTICKLNKITWIWIEHKLECRLGHIHLIVLQTHQIAILKQMKKKGVTLESGIWTP